MIRGIDLHVNRLTLEKGEVDLSGKLIPSSILTSAKEKDPRGSRCWGGCLNNEQCADPTSGAAVWTGGAL